MKKYFEKAYKGSKLEFLNLLETRIDEEKGNFVVTANPEIFMFGKRTVEMDEALMGDSTLIVPDGIGIIRAGEQLGYHFKERIPGVEICEALFSYADKNRKSVYFFGAQRSVLKALICKVKQEYPGVEISGYADGYVADKDIVFKKIVEKKPDIVLVALGVPQQELLIYKYFRPEEKGIYIGVGGSFDVLSGKKKRAPAFFIKHNLEWLYRITTEPKRMKRFWNSNVKFMFEIRKERNGNRR